MPIVVMPGLWSPRGNGLLFSILRPDETIFAFSVITYQERNDYRDLFKFIDLKSWNYGILWSE